MPKTDTILEEMLENWGYARAGVIAELANLPEKSLHLRPAPGARTPAEIAVHIAESGAMMAGELTRADGDFRRKSWQALIREHGRALGRPRSRRQLLDLLRRSHRDGERRFRAAGEVMLLQRIRRFDGKTGTRLAWMTHGIAHEEYHRGQLAFSARAFGEVPALTKLILG